MLKQIKTVITESIQEIEDYATGKKPPIVKTSLSCFNRVLGGGLPWKTSTIIAAPSGGGKTTLINSIDFSLFDLNRNQSIAYIFFSLEISPLMLIAKKACSILNKTVEEVLSFETKLDTKSIAIIKAELQKYEKYPIYFYSDDVTAAQIEQIVTSVYKQLSAKDPNIGIIYAIDHGGLVTSDKDEDENKIISGLSKTIISIKRKIPKSINVILSQFNSRIEETTRILTPSLHYPVKADLFGGKTIWHAADNVIMLNRPELLSISHYGVNMLPTEDRIFGHVIKQRYGNLGLFILSTTELKYSRLIEVKDGKFK
jgi:replicative DNA helicase